MTPPSEKAKEAGLNGLNDLLSGSLLEDWPSHERSVQAILEGAEPIIRAEERERIKQWLEDQIYGLKRERDSGRRRGEISAFRAALATLDLPSEGEAEKCEVCKGKGRIGGFHWHGQTVQASVCGACGGSGTQPSQEESK